MARKKLQIELAPELYDELVDAAGLACCDDVDRMCTPEDFAKECVESVLASRRLERIAALT